MTEAFLIFVFFWFAAAFLLEVQIADYIASEQWRARTLRFTGLVCATIAIFQAFHLIRHTLEIMGLINGITV